MTIYPTTEQQNLSSIEARQPMSELPKLDRRTQKPLLMRSIASGNKSELNLAQNVPFELLVGSVASSVGGGGKTAHLLFIFKRSRQTVGAEAKRRGMCVLETSSSSPQATRRAGHRAHARLFAGPNVRLQWARVGLSMSGTDILKGYTRGIYCQARCWAQR